MAQYHADSRKIFLKEKKGLIALTLILIAVFFFLPVTQAFAYNNTSAVVVMDVDTGEIVHNDNGDIPMEIASTTKVLTAITVIENADIFMRAAIPAAAVGVEGSSIYLREGEKWRVLDLLYGLMLRSGNDAAVALAIITSGNLPAFVELMNKTAEKAGAVSSRFTNPHGLHEDGHKCTATDLAKITAYALKCPIFAEIVKTKTHRAVKTVEDKEENVVFYNKNKLLYSYPYAIGVKTGYTKHSGRCLVAAAEKEGRKLVCVTLNVYDTYGVSKSMFERYFGASERDGAEIS